MLHRLHRDLHRLHGGLHLQRLGSQWYQYLQIPNHQAFMHGTKRHARSVVDGATSGASRGQGKLRCQPLLRRRLS